MWYTRSAHANRSVQPIPVFRILGLVTVVLILRGCAAHRVERQESAACAPVDEQQLAAGVRAEALEGAFRLTLVATNGPKRGESATGRLVLVLNDSAMRRMEEPGGTYRLDAHMPLIGTTDLAVEDVGAVRLGDLESSDSTRPGVALLERRVVEPNDTTRTEITLRLGSEANRRDVVRFDGGFMALSVHSVTEHAFHGTWASGVREPAARGYFCATRSETP